VPPEDRRLAAAPRDARRGVRPARDQRVPPRDPAIGDDERARERQLARKVAKARFVVASPRMARQSPKA